MSVKALQILRDPLGDRGARAPRVKDRIRVIYRGIDRSAFDPAAVGASAVENLRAQWGVPPGAKIVLHAARLTSIKGQRDLIAAAPGISAAFDDALLRCGVEVEQP